MWEMENMKSTQREMSTELKNQVVIIYSLGNYLNTTTERFQNLENKVNLNMTYFQMETRSFWNKTFYNLISNISHIMNISNVMQTSLQNLLLQEMHHKLSEKRLNQSISTLESNIEQLEYEQNETNAKIAKIKRLHTSSRTEISHLFSISMSLQKSVEGCEKNISDVQSGNFENNIEIKHLQNQFRIVESNLSHFQTLNGQISNETEILKHLINMTQHNNAEIRTAVTGLESNLRLLQESEKKTGTKMRNFDSEWSSFQSQYRTEMDSIRDSVNATMEDYKILADLTEASSASCESNITTLNMSLNQFTGQFSSVNTSIAKLDQDSTTYNALLENSKTQINNITTTVLELQNLQRQMNTTGIQFHIKN
jgi:chromosome segregation ATPase